MADRRGGGGYQGVSHLSWPYLGRGSGLRRLAASLVPADAHGSNCFDHYNPAAWKGKGLAIIFCRNNSDSTKGSYIAQCELRHHKGAKIQSLTRHGSLDKGRVLYADYNTTGAKFRLHPARVPQEPADRNSASPWTSCARPRRPPP